MAGDLGVYNGFGVDDPAGSSMAVGVDGCVDSCCGGFDGCSSFAVASSPGFVTA